MDMQPNLQNKKFKKIFFKKKFFLDNFVRPPHKWSHTELQEIFREKVHQFFFEIWVMFSFRESFIKMRNVGVPQKTSQHGVFWRFSDLWRCTARYPEYAEVQKFFCEAASYGSAHPPKMSQIYFLGPPP